MPFFQDGPTLGNQYTTDRVLKGYLARALPHEIQKEIEAELREAGELAGGELYRDSLEQIHSEPSLIQWDAWGKAH